MDNIHFESNCYQFWDDFNECKKYNKNIINNLDVDYKQAEPQYFNFFECKQYKNITNILIQFNPSNITYPYNKKYSIKKNNDVIKIKLYD